MAEIPWYFIPKTDLSKFTENEVNTLKTHNEVIVFSIVQNETEIEGFAFPSTEYENIKIQIPALIIEEQAQSSIDGVIIVSLKNNTATTNSTTSVSQPEYEVSIESSWNGDFSPIMFKTLVKNILSPVVKLPIMIYNMHGGTIQNQRTLIKKSSNYFNIFIWGKLKDYQFKINFNKKIFGIGGLTTSQTLQTSNLGTQIIDTETGDIPAEIYKNSLLINFDIVHCGTQNEIDCLTILLNKTAIILQETKQQKEERLVAEEKALKLLSAKQSDEVISNIIEIPKQKIGVLEQQISATLETLTNLQKKITENYYTLKSDRFLLQTLQQNSSELKEKFKKELIMLLNLPEIERINMGTKYDGIGYSDINIHTHPIIVEHPENKKQYLIGRFLIQLGISTSNFGKILFFNKDRLVKGYNNSLMQAPHVFQTGTPCLGTHADNVAQLFASFELFALGAYVINFIKSVTTSDAAGAYLSKWPEIKSVNSTGTKNEIVLNSTNEITDED